MFQVSIFVHFKGRLQCAQFPYYRCRKDLFTAFLPEACKGLVGNFIQRLIGSSKPQECIKTVLLGHMAPRVHGNIIPVS